MNLTDKFIDGLLSVAHPLTIQTINQTRNCLLDYFGVLIGGKRYLKGHHQELIDSFSDGTPKENAFLNGFAAHVLELDDGHRQGMIHLGSSIISAVLAVAEKEKLPLESALRGITMGYESAVRCARAVQPGHKMRGYHVSGTCGTIGSALGVAFACNYNEEQLHSTLACAVSSAAGVLEIQEQASELKPYNVGRAAMAGVVAAQIGKLAIPGPDDILGGERGFLVALTDTPKPGFLIDFSKNRYCIEEIYQKVHAACRHCHPAIDATLSIRKNVNLQPDQVYRVEVHTYKLAVGSHNHVDIRGISSAKLSTPYSVALAIVKGRLGYADYNENNLNDKTIKRLAHEVQVMEDPELTLRSSEVRGARVNIFLKNGQSLEATCYYPKGEPENPLTSEEVETKFRELAMYGGMNEAECDEVISEIRKEDSSLSKVLSIICKK